MSTTVTVYCQNEDCELDIEVDVTPGYKPLYGIGPDHPAYADPGDDGSIEYQEHCPHCGMAQNEKALEASAIDAYEDHVRSAEEDAARDRYESMKDD